MVQWLGLSAFTAFTQVQSLVGELRSQKSCGAAKNRIKKRAERRKARQEKGGKERR